MEDEENKFESKLCHETKLKELLRNLTSVELQLCSDSSKQFLKLMNSDSGPEFLHLYIRNSSNCIELEQAWDLRKSKTGLHFVLNLISGILNHPCGKNISALDKFAKSIVDKRMNDLYKELNSKDAKRQRAVLFLLASVVRRSSWIAWDVAKCFDFKNPIFRKLAEWKGKHHSTRKAFVGFSMSFLEVGNARLLRGVLQQKEMYSGVLRGLGNDDEDTVVYMLSTLRNRVLVSDSLVPTGLRSVLFGSVTLEQLASVSGRGDEAGELAVELAHQMLFVVCTDPLNGLMPDLKRGLRGNLKRLLGLMKKLKASEVDNHRNLLLAIVKGKPSFGSAYLDEFPYNVEDPSSRYWFASVSLAANVLSSVGDGLAFGFIDSWTQEPPTLDSPEIQNIMRCIKPRPFSRQVINTGLLDKDPLVKHGTLKLVLEVQKLLELLIGALNIVSCSQGQMIHKWEFLKQDILNAVRIFLPNPQVLFSLLSSLDEFYRDLEPCSKRRADSETRMGVKMNSRKKLKVDVANEDADILVGGVSYSPGAALPLDDEETMKGDGMSNSKDGPYFVKLIIELWGLHSSPLPDSTEKDTKGLFNAKLLNSLTSYYKTMPTMLEGLNFFEILPDNPLALPTNLQQALLSLLLKHVGWSTKCKIATRVHPILDLLMYSPNREIKDQAYILAKALMHSTGAFDKNPKEICSWFFFIPGYTKDNMLGGAVGCDIYRKLSSPVVLFLCDAVIEIGKRLYYYLDLLRSSLSSLQGAKDTSPDFSPFTICILDKCLTLVTAESSTFSASEKSMISLYVCNTLKYLLETQMDPLLLSSIINLKLSERIEASNNLNGSQFLCEWRPFKSLLYLSQRILQKTCRTSGNIKELVCPDTSFTHTVGEVQRLLKSESDDSLVGVTTAFCFSMTCTKPAEIIENFPLILSTSSKLHGVPFSLLMLLFFSEPNILIDASKRWPEVFFTGLERVISGLSVGRTMDFSAISSIDYSVSDAFSVFLDRAPFYILFPAVLDIGELDLSEQSGLLNLLHAKLSERTSDHLLSSLHYLLFWLNQAQLSHRNEQSKEVEKLSEACFLLLNHVLKNLNTCTTSFVEEFVVTILDHPAVTAVLEYPTPVNSDFACGVISDSVDQFVKSAKLDVCKMDHHVLNLLKATCELWLSFCAGESSSSEVNHANKHVTGSFKNVVKKLVLAFKHRMNECITSKSILPLAPTLHAILSLIHLISPFEMLELIDWMLSVIDLDDCPVWLTSALCVGLQIAASAFSHLAVYIHEMKPPYLSWRTKEEQFDAILYEKIFLQVYDISTRFKLDVADTCLLNAIKVVKVAHKPMQMPSYPFLKFTCRVVANTPIDILSHCMNKITKAKAQILFLVADISPLHLSAFGKLFVSKYMSPVERPICDEDMVLLLPTVILYLNSVPAKFMKLHECVISLYWGILKQGFSIWEKYVSGEIFKVEYCENLSMEEFPNLVSTSLLASSVLTVQLYFELRGDLVKVKERLSIFNSICSSDLLEFDPTQDGNYSVVESLNVVNRVVAKILLCRTLLIPENSKFPDTVEDDCSTLDLARVRFLDLLVQSWQFIVKRCSLSAIDLGQMEVGSCSLFRYLELYVLRNAMELTNKMHDFRLVEQLVKSSLLHRFDDPITLRWLRSIISSVPEGKFSCISIIQLLLAHSQFAATIQYSHISAGCSHFGLTFTPLPSIMRSYVSCTDLKDSDKLSQQCAQKLELVKLLRLLFQIRAQQCDIDNAKDIGINLRELIFLLLSSYGASMSEIDLEIYCLMDEINSTIDFDEGSMAKFDYLWGSAVLKVRKDNENLSESEAVDEYRKIHFRENIPIDPKVSAATVLYFPYDRTVSRGVLKKSKEDNGPDFRYEVHYPDVEKIKVYDPIFILHFSAHCLSMGFIEPLEFASLGLLAITVVSISSPDDDMRRLGYEVLVRFRRELMKYQKKKDVIRLRLLISYLENSIEVDCQQMSSVTTVFVAEASFVLLDPMHDHYSAISKYLMCSSSANVKGIPLFHKIFKSSSTNFRAERVWMLRLLHSGVNIKDDAFIYIRNAIRDTLLIFYVSPFSDVESKELIIQIVKKSVRIPEMARYLVEQCGLIPWISSVISSLSWSRGRSGSVVELTLILEALSEIILSMRHIVEWVSIYGSEQLCCSLWKVLVEGVEMLKEKTDLVQLILQILTSAMKISKTRKIYQPHFTLSTESLFQLCQVVDECCDGRPTSVAVIGLEALLMMTTPPLNILRMDEEKVSKFVSWANLTALHSKLEKQNSEEEAGDTLISKLVRWLSASVILGKLTSPNPCHSFDRSKLNNLQSLLEMSHETKRTFACEETLASSIFFLQQLECNNYTLLPSAVSALCLLLFPAETNILGGDADQLETLCSMINCPAEVNPAWKWSFYQPWKTDSCAVDDKAKLQESQACRMLLVVTSKLLARNSLYSHFISFQDVHKLALFDWETSAVQSL